MPMGLHRERCLTSGATEPPPRQENRNCIESIQNGEQRRTVFRSLLQVANIIRITAKTATFDRHIGVAGKRGKKPRGDRKWDER